MASSHSEFCLPDRSFVDIVDYSVLYYVYIVDKEAPMMEETKLTASEWNILNCLWEHSPRTVMQLAGELEKTVGWARSTTITTLHRMEAKGLVRQEQCGRGRAYLPLVDREQAAVAETHSFLDRVYRGSVGLMMSAMARRQELSSDEIAALRAILDQAEQEAEQ